MSALRRVLAVPGLVAALWLGQLAVALAAGFGVSGSMYAALQSYRVAADERILYALGDITTDHPSIVSHLGAAVVGSALLAAAVWLVLSPVLISRLAGRPVDRSLAALRSLPQVAAATGWHLLLRGILVAAIVVGTRPLPLWITVALLGIALVISTYALDLVRARVVVGGAPGTHARTAATAFADAIRNPRPLLMSAAVSVLSWALLGVTAAVAAGSLTGSIAVARIVAVATVFVGLWRLSIAVEAAGADPQSDGGVDDDGPSEAR